MTERIEETKPVKNNKFLYAYVSLCVTFLLIGLAEGIFWCRNAFINKESEISNDKVNVKPLEPTESVENTDKLKNDLILNCETEEDTIFSEDKRYKACLLDGEYNVGRIMALSDDNYYTFESKFGTVKYGTKEYIAYPDYYFRYAEAEINGGNFSQIYSRIFEVDTEKKDIKVVADPFMLPDVREWQTSYDNPQFMIFSKKDNHISPNGRYLITAVASCTQCATTPTYYVVDLTLEKLTEIGLFFDNEETPFKWLNDNTLEWYELSVEESANGEGLGGFEFKNIGKRITTF